MIASVLVFSAVACAGLELGTASHGAPPAVVLVEGARLTPNGAAARLAPAAATGARAQAGTFLVRGFPLADGSTADLRLERFAVTSNRTRFVVGTDRGDEPLAFDPDDIVLLRGSVAGLAGSHVFLSIAGDACLGRIELGPGRPTFAVTSGSPGAAPGEVSVLPARVADGPALARSCPPMGPPIVQVPPGLVIDEPVRGMRQGEIAVDSDYPLYLLFGSEERTAAYLVLVYGQVSDVMMRDLRIRLDIVFLRVFNTPSNPYGWNGGFPQIPAGVPRDLAQMLSGTRDVGAGGGAFLCGSASWVGFALGQFTDPATSNVHNQDIIIAAHELGHNLGARHTHDVGVDTCHLPATPPRRGDIMSYCYYFSGGYSNTDLRFHVKSQQSITACMANRLNFVPDCNQNQVADLIDIQSGFSRDLNSNAIPDECEDCNGNGVLDSVDIQSGFSRDLNGNGIPDECEPDCNGNGVPDDRDILLGTSQDLHGNGIPDECEADCNGNGVSDYSEIMANMSLDVDRNGVLDACQDCDGNGIPDLVELQGANNLWAVSSTDGVIREYHGVTGVLIRSSPAGHLTDPQDLMITPTRRILVASAGDDRVVEFDRSGAYVRDLVSSGASGLDGPGGMALAPDGTLLVASRLSGAVLRFDASTGAPLGTLVTPGTGGLAQPYGLAFAPGGGLLVTSSDNRVLEFNGATGAFVRVFVGSTGNGGLSSPRALLVLPGRVLVSSELTDRILEYDAATGAYLRQFNYGSFGHGLDGAWGLRLGPDGRVYASGSLRGDFHLTDPRVLSYDAQTGWLIRSFVQRPDSQLSKPRGLDFMPGKGLDCNVNHLPDSCDIASGRSADRNGNGVPDECEACYADCNGDGVLNLADFGCFQSKFALGDGFADCTRDGLLGVADFACFQTRFALGCP